MTVSISVHGVLHPPIVTLILGLSVVLLPWLTLVSPISLGATIAAMMLLGATASYVLIDIWSARAAAFGLFAITVPWFGLMLSDMAAHLLLGLCIQ